jgi:hypothetical protein
LSRKDFYIFILLPLWPTRDRRSGNVRFLLKILKFVRGFVDDIHRGEEGLIESLSPSEMRKGPQAKKKKLKNFKEIVLKFSVDRFPGSI